MLTVVYLKMLYKKKKKEAACRSKSPISLLVACTAVPPVCTLIRVCHVHFDFWKQKNNLKKIKIYKKFYDFWLCKTTRSHYRIRMCSWSRGVQTSHGGIFTMVSALQTSDSVWLYFISKSKNFSGVPILGRYVFFFTGFMACTKFVLDALVSETSS